MQFELTANEADVSFQCRLVPRDASLHLFTGAPDTWTVEETRVWLASQPESNATAACGVSDAECVGLHDAIAHVRAGNLTASDILAQHGASSAITGQLAARLQSLSVPFVSCGSEGGAGGVSEGGGEAGVVRYSHLQLQHGLMLFQARAVDAAGNVGEAATYKWFVDAVAPRVVVSTTSTRRNSSALDAAFAVDEPPTEASFIDHTGVCVQREREREEREERERERAGESW